MSAYPEAWHGLVLTVMLTGCISPQEHLYLLDEEPPAEANPRQDRDTVLLGPVTVPPEVDRPQIVVKEEGNEVALNEQQRWAQPLKEALPQLLATELTRASSYRFVIASSATAGTPSARLAVDIEQFQVSRTRGATVAAHWLYRSSAGGSERNADAVGTARIDGSGYAGLVDALQRATIELAHQIARQLPP